MTSPPGGTMNGTADLTALAPLGRDALDEQQFTELVEAITAEPGARPTAVQVVPVDYLIGTPSTEQLLRLFGTAELPSGEQVAWSCFVKKLQSVRHWPMIHLVPEPVRQDFIDNMPWRLEIAVHRSDLAAILPDGLRLPTAYRIDEHEDDRAVLWMENVDQAPGCWPMERFERAAYLLGRLSARRQVHLVKPFLPSTGTETPGIGLRYYTNGRVLMTALPGLADEQTWRHPLLASAVCNAGDHGLRDDLLELGERLPAVLDALDALPQTYQHGDASPQNLLVPKDNEDEFVVIDWGFDCPQAVGFDLGQLLIGLAHAGELSADALPMIHRVILRAFMEGLAADGMQVPEEQVRYGYLGSMLCRAAFTALPLDLFGKNDSATEGLFYERVRLTRAIIDLVKEID
ncbi:phosphotransferase family enzyme [Kribbella voronezhensis]|uniref:Phosphotransferase family enzyme n=1 Tax=Kribbella voronezhensis TaxID=2512212 RepID=A0A4R7TIL0_9ACTN|nr:phosphotransferase [Kribbella voronezhensis]TDU91438.1 phosphotransferase family enzyme [Kribbella voronezhensis]